MTVPFYQVDAFAPVRAPGTARHAGSAMPVHDSDRAPQRTRAKPAAIGSNRPRTRARGLDPGARAMSYKEPEPCPTGN